jgi:cytochrome c551/c552
MKDCPVAATVASALPDYAMGSHGNLGEQYRPVGPARGTDTSGGRSAKGKVAAATADTTATLAGAKGCLACHGTDKRIVGPGFREVAAKYKGDSGAQARLVAKVREGGSGVWGAVPMPPHPALSEADGDALVRWVLSGAP